MVQDDGNLVLYAPGNNAIWSSETMASRSFGPDDRDTPGAWARCWAATEWLSYVPNGRANISCQIKDLLRDGNAVFVHWQVDGWPKIRLYNRDGNGSLRWESDTFAADSASRIHWRVCRDRRPGRDNCSGWVTHIV
jgi:hypothetical protein